EVGPDQRVIFLELPVSIYTVDGKADDHLARVEWEVTRYYDEEPDVVLQNDEICKQMTREGKLDRSILAALRWKDRHEAPVNKLVAELKEAPARFGCLTMLGKRVEANQEAMGEKVDTAGQQPYPITLSMVAREIDNNKKAYGKPADDRYKAGKDQAD